VFANGGDGSRASKLAYYRLSWLPSTFPLHMVMPGVGSVLPDWAIAERAREVPQATTTVIELAGHLVGQEAPRELGRDLAAFLASVERGAKSRL
jgi:pimeloyl-ACP methyl ester carboxylesterase